MLIVRLLSLFCLAAALAIADPSMAAADTCRNTVTVNENGEVVLKLSCQDDSSKGSGSPDRRVCSWNGHEVACENSLGRWYSPATCWIKRADPQPPFSDPAWNGRATGALYYCRVAPDYNTGTPLLIWLGSVDPPPDPESLAREAVRRMQLRPISIGIAPEDSSGSVGLVGMPVWLWAESPSARTMGPISESASESGYTVRATAKVERVRWRMGDGGSRTCSGPGTAYKTQFGIAESPTCGYRYDRQGEYTVTAVTDWLVSWSGIGETGTFTVSLSEYTQIVIGELNVLTVNGKG